MSKSRSSSNSATSYVDNRAVLGEGAVQATNGGVNYVLDGGAINRSFDTTDAAVRQVLGFGGTALNQALEFGADNVDAALDFGLNALNYSKATTAATLDTLQTTQQMTADAYADAKGRGAMTDKILIGAVVAVAIVAFAAVRARRA